jgi:tetratricopeptide (TPR) repeat protein
MPNRAERIAAYQTASKEADKLSALGRREQAKEILKLQRAAAEQAGDEDYDCFLQAELLCRDGEYSKAAQRLDAALAWVEQHGHAPDAFLFRSRGVYESLLDNEDAAIEWFDKALAINPQDTDAMRQRGVSLSAKGQQDAAIGWFDKALAINPQDANAMRERGASLSRKRQEDAAIEWYDKALAVNPKDANAMRNKGVSLSVKGQEDAAIEWYDKALAVNPKDANAVRNKGVSLLKLHKTSQAVEWLGRAVQLDPAQWQGDFRAVCKLAGKDADKEWLRLFPKLVPAPAQPKDDYGELKLFIQVIRTRLQKQAERYLEQKKSAEERRTEFLKPESRLSPDRSLLMVLRKWNSFTPALPVSEEDERSRGGGYFLWHNGRGTVIDPGFNFLENFHLAGGRFCDIDNVIVTHAHADHTAEFETLRTLLFEYNENLPRENKQRARTNPPAPPLPLKRVRFLLNLGSFQKFTGLLDLQETTYTESLAALTPGGHHQLLGGAWVRALPAYHDEVLSRQHAVGLLFTLGEGEQARRILFTSDTGLFPLKRGERKPLADDTDPKAEVGLRYLDYLEGKQPDVLIAHIGSINPDEFDTQKTGIAESCYANHLGIIGTARVIAICKPRLAIVSEFGEEMRDFRYDLIKDLRDTVLRLYFQDKGGNPPGVVPGDLAFVHSIQDHTFLDCATCQWAPADKIDFWEEKDPADIYYALKIPPDPIRCREALKLYKGYRDAHHGLYFAQPAD